MMRWTQQVLLIFVVLFINSQTAESQLPTPNVFAVRGAVYTADGVTLAGDGFGVMVENVTKGLIREDLTGSTAGPSRYVVAFVDFNTPVVDDSDLIQVTVTQEATGEVLATKQVIVTPTDLGAGFLVLDLNFTSSSDGSYVLAILGQILLSDGIPAGDGLTVTVENLSQGVRQTDVTGTYAGPSRYVVTFVDTETPVANAGDEIEIRVEDALGLMLGNTRVTLSTDALNAGVQKIDVTLTAVEGGNQVFAVRGTVFTADSATLGGDGLRVTVENLSKGMDQTDVTGTFAGPSQYVTTFIDTEDAVVAVDDEIEVRIEDTTGKLLGTAQAQLSADAIDVGFTTIDVILTAISFPWDINGDGTVNIFDLVLVGSQFGQSGLDLNGDVNNDGTVNVFDLVIVGSHFGESTAIAAPLATKARKSDNLLSR